MVAELFCVERANWPSTSFRPALSFVLLSGIGTVAADDRAEDREAMVKEQIITRGVKDPTTLTAMRAVPRHLFVTESLAPLAYHDRPLPIGYGQTISQPLIVALMTEIIKPGPERKILEIGTGSGYQSAVLSQLVKQVYSIEIIEPLGLSTAQLLDRLAYKNIETRIADGYDGWPQQAPFDGIIVTAAISHIPPPLVRQLKKGGRMIIPVGSRFQTQYLTLVEKDKQGTITTRQILPVTFVPFTGGH